MKKAIIVCMAIVMMVTFGLTSVNAEPSSKVTANAGDLMAIDTLNQWTTVMKNQIKTAQEKDLFIDVSAEIGLTTNTKVASRLLIKAISEAEALVKIRVLIDNGDVPVVPGMDGVVFERRTQALIAEFAGALAYYDDEDNLVSCISIDPNGALIIDKDCIEEETLGLILDTMAAHSFNFIAKDVPVGLHTIEVQALLDYTQLGDAISDEDLQLIPVAEQPTRAYLGQGSVTVEEVRMIKDEDISPEVPEL